MADRSDRRTVDKHLLKNIIRHTDAHNKIQEQNEMWKLWKLKKQSRKDSQFSDRGRQVRGYMRSDKEHSLGTNSKSLKWNRLLMEYEETCKDRWGHSGYKELYPEEFEADHGSHACDLESDCDSDRKQDTNTKSVKKEKKMEKSKKEKKKNKRKLSDNSSDSDLKYDHKHKKQKRFRSHRHSRSSEKKAKKRNKRTEH